MKKLENKVVFITGGNSGIGKASALEAAREGAIIVVADIASNDHRETIAEIKALGAICRFVPIDLSDVESVKMAINTTVKEFGRLDVAFNNASDAGVYSGIHDMPEYEWEKSIAANLTSQFYCVKYELQQFLKQGGGIIVNMASLGSLNEEHGFVPYTVAKYGVLGLTKKIAVQYATQNIRGNAICPYYVETPLLIAANEEGNKTWIDEAPTKRKCKPEEVAKAFIYLACDDSIFCNGYKLYWTERYLNKNVKQKMINQSNEIHSLIHQN